MKSKAEVKPGDPIHIFTMFGERDYSEREGTVTYIDDMNQIFGTWGGLALHYDDDWMIMEDE